MSTETTNKKIKIDNGTTFGRTYTDKAVDELLKNVGGGVGISVIELTDKNGTIASAQLGEINANPQNFAFKYNGKILLFTRADSTTYQYCNNTTNSSENNVMTTSTLLTIQSSTGAYTIAEEVHNVVANSIHPANGGDLTNIQVGSKVYSIPSGVGGGGIPVVEGTFNSQTFEITISEAQTRNFILHTSEFGYIYMSNSGDLYDGSLIMQESDGRITIMTFASKEGSPTILDLILSTFNPNNIPDINITTNNLTNMISAYGVNHIDFSDVLKTRFLYVLDTKSIPSKIYPLYYISENEYKGFGMFMYNNMTYLETYTLSITNNIGTITTVTGGFKTHQLFDEYSILVPKDSPDANILPLPSDAYTSTYVLKAVNGTVQWVKES